MLRREALCLRASWETFAGGLSQQVAAAEGSLIRVVTGEVGAALAKPGRVQYCQPRPYADIADCHHAASGSLRVHDGPARSRGRRGTNQVAAMFLAATLLGDPFLPLGGYPFQDVKRVR